MIAKSKAGAPQVWNLGLDWKQIVLEMEEGGSEKPVQPMDTDRGEIPKTPEICGPPEMTRKSGIAGGLIGFSQQKAVEVHFPSQSAKP